ncbi:MAG: folylpolyglutamate synthase/dihydrofolate synthase family protein [Bacillota bacterium]|nr:folylpolyglutamate synthase/dihydrofolate synthase family protein [Bacillota bacterium]
MINAVEKLHEFDKFGSRLGMERMNVVLEKLGNPHENLRVIHVAGTNGKGSVCKYLEEGLAACGYKVGLYTSPYIERFNERIRLGGHDISDEDLGIYTEKVLEAVDEMISEGHDSPTEFEVVTAIALLYFKEKQADITILEVGLGGSGDSTNVIRRPLICAITSISYDHMDRLGNTLGEIAADKAGIIKSGVPVVSNVDEPEAARVIAAAAYQKGSRLYDISKLKFSITEESPVSQKVSMELYETDYSDVEISMTGIHQAENLKTALAVIEILRKKREIKVERSRLYEGLKRAVQPGRFEVISGSEDELPMVVIDGAHNEAGADALRQTAEKFFHGRRILLVTGMLADKQVDEIIEHFVRITEDIIATEPDNPRKLSCGELEAKLKARGISPLKSVESAECVDAARSIWDGYEVVIFAGSLYLIGDVRRVIKNG